MTNCTTDVGSWKSTMQVLKPRLCGHLPMLLVLFVIGL